MDREPAARSRVEDGAGRLAKTQKCGDRVSSAAEAEGRGSRAICAKHKSVEREAWASLANDVVRTGSDIMAIQAQPRAQ